LDAFHHLKHVENIAALKSQPPPPPPLPLMETYPGAGAVLSDYIAEPQNRYTQGYLEMNLQKHSLLPICDA